MTPTHNRYPIDNLSDLLELTPSQFERLLPDLKAWHTINKDPAKIIGHAIPEGTAISRNGFVWIDDGETGGTVRVNYKLGSEDGPIIHKTKRFVSQDGTVSPEPFSAMSWKGKLGFLLGRATRYAIWFPIKYTFGAFSWLTHNSIELSTALVFFILIALDTWMDNGTPDWDKAFTYAIAVLIVWLFALIFGKGFGDGMARTKAMHWTTKSNNLVYLNGDQLKPVKTDKGDVDNRPISPEGADK